MGYELDREAAGLSGRSAQYCLAGAAIAVLRIPGVNAARGRRRALAARDACRSGHRANSAAGTAEAFGRQRDFGGLEWAVEPRNGVVDRTYAGR